MSASSSVVVNGSASALQHRRKALTGKPPPATAFVDTRSMTQVCRGMPRLS
jgi:hypothetical protein